MKHAHELFHPSISLVPILLSQNLSNCRRIFISRWGRLPMAACPQPETAKHARMMHTHERQGRRAPTSDGWWRR
uniref:Uncharacterized protein n=1 Tax=Arundo donax TaxID=35708 RepID=A0A0A8YJ09_ARUDO